MQKLLSESKRARWTVLALIATVVFFSCFFVELMAPLKPILESELGWGSADFGFFSSAFGFFNIFFLMLILSGIILDRIGIRFTGVLSFFLMVLGACIKYWAISTVFPEDLRILGIKYQVAFASLGFAIFGVGMEAVCITASKTIVKWFKGKELALAMSLQISATRIGIMFSLSASVPVSNAFNSISAPLMLGIVFLCIGFISFLVYTIMDRQFDREKSATIAATDAFKLADIGVILKNKAFWLIALTCLFSYSSVFPFLKYAVDLIINKFNVPLVYAGYIPAILPFASMLCLPLFGHLFDRRGRGVSMIIIGVGGITLIHLIFSLPFVHFWPIAVGLMLLLGINFALVGAVVWPSLAKIIPERQLGTANSLVFYIKGWGQMGMPFVIGMILDRYCITGTNALGANTYDYTLPMIIFAVFCGLSILTSLALKAEDKRKNYGLE